MYSRRTPDEALQVRHGTTMIRLLRHTEYQSIPIVIENEKGTERQGKGWTSIMTCQYGYIEGVQGADGDELDCFVGPNASASRVYIINQVKGNGHFDEHKIMLGFSSTGEAEGCYNAHYPPSISRLQTITDMSMAQFIRKLKTHRWNNAV